MKIVHLSDTHGLHNDILDMPEGDIIVHTGDCTMSGSAREAIDFLHWFVSLPYRYKIFVAGNHDRCLWGGVVNGLPDGCYFLDNLGVVIDGVLFYGVPMYSSKFLPGQQDINNANIPAQVDVLVTHQPPYGIMDYDGRRRYGSKVLLSRVNVVKPRIHLFGHIHSAFGAQSNGATDFYNSAMVSDSYALCNHPHVILL